MDYSEVTLLGKWLSQHALPLFSWFKDESFAPTLAVVIVIAAAVITVKSFLLRFIPAWLQLGSCARRLKSYKNWEEFSKSFGDFDQFMAKRVKLLRHGWAEFTETVIPPGDGENRPVWITIRPSVFLNMSDAEQALGLKRFLGWANIFVGIGLLLTFLGLVAALFFAALAIKDAAGTEKGTQQAMQQALVQLLNTATFKFWTSIAGLGCSIVITLLHKYLSLRINRLFGIICKRIEELTQTVTPEWFAHRQYEVLQEQSNQLRNFNDQLAFTLGQALEKAIQQAMPNLMTAAMSPVVDRLDHMQQSNGPAFEEALSRAMPPVMESAITPLTEQIGDMAKNISAMNQSAIHSLTQEFGNVVTANAGAELRELAGTLGQVRETLAATSQHVTGSGSEMSRQLAEATAELRSVMDTLVEGIGRLSQGVDSDVNRTQQVLESQLKSVGENLETLAKGIKASIADMGGQLTTTSHQAAEALNSQIASALMRIESAVESGTASLDALVGSFRSAAQDAAGSLAGETAGAARAMQEAVERMAASMDEATRQMRAGASEASGVLSSRLLESIQDLQESTRQNAIQIREAVTAIVEASDVARQDVGRAVKQVGVDLDEKGQEAASQLAAGTSSVINHLSATVDGLNSSMKRMVSAMSEIEIKLSGHAGSLEGLNTSARSTADIMAGTAKSLKEATTPLGQAEQGLSRVTDSLKHSVERIFEKMQPIQEELKRLSQQTTGTLDRLQSVWTQYEKRFEAVDTSLGKTVETIIGNLKGNAMSFSEYIKNVDSHLASTVEQFAGNIQELAYTAEQLRKATETLRQVAR